MNSIERALNNGRGHTKNPATIPGDYFEHRTYAEVLMTRALKLEGVIFSALPVFDMGNYQRAEIDHIILKDGMVLLQELDGPSHRGELMLDAEKRLEKFRDEGFFIRRYEQPEEVTLSWCTQRARESIRFMEKMLRIYGRRP